MSQRTLAALADEFDVSGPRIDELAQRAAEQVHTWCRMWRSMGTPEEAQRVELRRLCRRFTVDLPACALVAQQLNRMCAPAWWRRALRQRFRIVEQHQRIAGKVHRQASAYVSPKTLHRHRRRAVQMAQLLDGLEAMNLNTGEARPLPELIEKSQANPAMRRAYLMSRIRGIEAFANDKGDRSFMATITAPGRMHSFYATGHAVSGYDGSNPRQVQAYLHRVWRNAIRAAKHAGIKAYGLRTIEPHHDGCPHWHVVVFVAADDMDALQAILRRYALADSPNEPGAAERRVTFENIDPTKGDAASYVAKYIAKAIDGHCLDRDDETDMTGPQTAERVTAWSSLWGMRQFQFFGLPAITPTRELYRLPTIDSHCQALTDAHKASRAKDYARYLRAVATGTDLTLRVDYEARRSSRYEDETTLAIRGLVVHAMALGAPLELVTRTEQWVIQPRKVQAVAGGDCLPWTRFNKSATPEKSTGCAGSCEPKAAPARGQPPKGRRRRPPATAGPHAAVA